MFISKPNKSIPIMDTALLFTGNDNLDFLYFPMRTLSKAHGGSKRHIDSLFCIRFLFFSP